MSIRRKLLSLLLAIAILPLILVSVLNVISLTGVQRSIESKTRQQLIERAEQQLTDMVKNYSSIVMSEGTTLQMAVRLVAERAGQCYDERHPMEETELFTNTDFDQKDPRITDLKKSDRHLSREGQHWVPIEVSHEHPVVLIPGNSEPAEIQRDCSVAPCLGDVFNVLQEREDIYPLWQYVAFNSGLHIAYPGHGGYKEEYDPRTRSWYQDTIEREAIGWSDPSIDATTGAVIFSVSAPVRDKEGNIVGVTGLDIRMKDVVEDVEITQAWSRNTDVMIVQTNDRDGNPLEELLVIAQQSYNEVAVDWSEPIELETISPPAGEETEYLAMVNDIRNHVPGVRELVWNGKLAFWAYSPTGQEGGGILMLVPVEDVLHQIGLIESTITRSLMQFSYVAGTTVLIVAVIVLLISLISAKTVTKPIAELSNIARSIAKGDLSVRATIRSNDEIGRLGHTVNNMIPKLQDRLRMKDSLSLAMQVQQHLLPQRPPEVPGVDIAGNSQPCDETGGDYYDYFLLGTQDAPRVGICIGDVTGHGAAAALLMASGRSILRQQIALTQGEGPMMTNVNRALAADTSGGRFMTMVYLVLDPGTRKVNWVNAGHERPIVVSVETDQVDELIGGGIPLGIADDWEYETQSRELSDGDQIIVLGTDGITEARNEQEEMFGKDRLIDLIRNNAGKAADDLVKTIQESLHVFRGAKPQLDDITLVVIRLPAKGENE